MLFDFRIIILGIVFVINLVFGVLVLAKSKKRHEGRSFSLFIFAVAAWAFGLLMFYLTKSEEASLFWAKTLYFAGNVIPICFLYFSYAFPERKASFAWWKTVLIFIPLVPIFFLYYFTDVVLIDTFSADGVKGFVYGSFRQAFDIPFSFYFLWAFVNLLAKYQKSAGQVRLQLRYMVTSVLAALVFAATTNVIMPWMGIFAYLWLGPVATLIIVVAITYAIIRHRLMDIRLVVKKGGVFAVSLVLASVVGLLGSSWIDRFSDFPVKVISAISILTSTSVFLPIFLGLQRFANKHLFAGIQTRYEALGQLSRKLTTLIDRDKLIKTVIQTLVKVLGVRKVAVWIRDEQHRYRVKATSGFGKGYGGVLTALSPLVNHLCVTCKPLLNDELSAGKVKSEMKTIGAQVCLPLLVNQELIGLIVLGKKGAGEGYTKEEIQLLESLASQTALAILNSQLYDQIKSFNERLQQKVDAQTKDLKVVNQRLEVLLRMKSEFLDTASHQLRTPVSIVRGTLSILVGLNEKLSSKANEQIADAVAATDRLEAILHDILLANELAGGTPGVRFDRVNIDQLVSEQVGKLKSSAKAKNPRIQYRKTMETIPEILAQPRFVTEAISKLLSNALVYTPKGSIVVTLAYHKGKKGTVRDDKVSIEIKDTGIGLTDGDRKILFKQFQKGRGGKKINVNSSGLGLYIVKEVALIHSGTITAQSEGKDKGATFILTLPIIPSM